MAVKIFKSSDTGAPVVTGAASTVIAMLQAVLVDGYNSKSITITRSGTTATVACTAHGVNDGDWIAVAGANEADYNGDHRITWINADSYSFTVANSPATPATGTITAKKSPLGWTVGFAGTNIKSWRSPDTKGYVEVSDPGTSTAITLYAYKTMSASATGTDKLSGVSGGTTKSVDSAGTQTQWMVIAGNGGNLVQLYTSQTSASTDFGSGTFIPSIFGSITSVLSGDVYNFMLGTADATPNLQQTFIMPNASLGSVAYLQLLRNYTGTATAPALSWHIDYQLMGASSVPGVLPSGTLAYPDNETGGVVLQPLDIFETVLKRKRGTVPGVFFTPQLVRGVLGSLGTITGVSGGLSGRNFMVIPVAPNSQAQACLIAEISDTW